MKYYILVIKDNNDEVLHFEVITSKLNHVELMIHLGERNYHSTIKDYSLIKEIKLTLFL